MTSRYILTFLSVNISCCESLTINFHLLYMNTFFLVPFARHVIAHSSSGAVDVHSTITWCAILLLVSLFMNYNSSDWICFQYWEYSCPSQCQESKVWKRFTWLKLIILQKQCNFCKSHLFSFLVVLLMQTNLAIFGCNHFNYNTFSYTYKLILCVFRIHTHTEISIMFGLNQYYEIPIFQHSFPHFYM